MALLAEYALTPDVFDTTAYSSEEVCGLHLQSLKEVLLHEGLVRDLRHGEWGRLFLGNDRSWHQRGKELLRKLVSQKRLIAFPPSRAIAPTTDAEWCDEALTSHQAVSLDGIIVSDRLTDSYRSNVIVSSIGRLSNALWWTGRSPSQRLMRTLAAYQGALDLILRHANSIMVIDPHVDPTEPRYKDLVALLERAGRRSPAPLIEIHRVAWYGSGQDKRPQTATVEAVMRAGLDEAAKRSGLSFDVFLWDDFHDRYLISNLVGISVPYGFDTTRASNVVTTWTRLGRYDRDDVQREFDVASNRHMLRHRFKVP